MPKYIDVDKLTARLSRAHKTHLNDGRVEYSCGILLASDIARHEPKADVVEVVRCKDCKYWAYEYCTRPTNARTTREEKKPDDFCSYGEKKGCTDCKELICDGCDFYEESEVEGE